MGDARLWRILWVVTTLPTALPSTRLQLQNCSAQTSARDDRSGAEGGRSDGGPVLGDAALDERLSSGRQNLIGKVRAFIVRAIDIVPSIQRIQP